ncbi:LysR family transcriptional regulator [Cupriavidus sp. USMAA2-4]|uniref:LysR substrate-binding domain-containing protein n=1 Tax=Cupriavidus sp. USMAA2-4 TaxID=876364 RepID=UPI0008A67589|nr:LysR substrate-binding domain-containing protein [Cupriavidus sp. USMAA2-4]AOY94379.1 LysR family transcriptional regulator [Cupriavidus sp. USMAA2-4]
MNFRRDPGGAGPGHEAFRKRVRLRHLHCFVAVAQLQHLGLAGEKLGLTQPAVSKTLSELEELVGARLLVRKRAGTDLTAAGMRFLRHALRVLDDLDEAARSVSDGPAAAERIRLGALPSVVPDLLFDVLTAFRQAHPDIAVAVQTGMNRPLIEWLKADRLDVVLGRMDDPAAMEGLWFEMLGTEPLVLAVRAGHPLAAARHPLLAEALACPLVLPAAGSVPRHSAESLLARHGLPLPAGCLETSDALLGQMTALATDAVWLAPLSAARRAIAQGVLVRLPLDSQGTEEPIGVLRRSGGELGPATEGFLRALREAAARRPQEQALR